MRKIRRIIVAAAALALAGCWSPTGPEERDPKDDTDGQGKTEQVGYATHADRRA